MFYTFLADVIAALHLGYVSFVVIGQLLILFGILLRWEWIRNFWFRAVHLAMIGIVALEAIGNIMCPLTRWENDLRALARADVGAATADDSFVARIVGAVMQYDIPFSHWIFKVAYVTFALLTLGTFIIAPPRWRKSAAAPQSPPLDKRKAGGTILAAIGCIFLYSAYCKAEYAPKELQQAINDYEEYLAKVKDSRDSAAIPKVNPPTKVDATPVYLMAFAGVNFLGLALVCWALGPPPAANSP